MSAGPQDSERQTVPDPPLETIKETNSPPEPLSPQGAPKTQDPASPTSPTPPDDVNLNNSYQVAERNNKPSRPGPQPAHRPDPPATYGSWRNFMRRQPTETRSLSYRSQPPSQLARNQPSQNTITSSPSYSLAGPGSTYYQPAPDKVYVDPEYQDYNPRYGCNNEAPVWGLAKPLPRVVRPGMRRDQSQQKMASAGTPNGQTQPAPEMGTTPGMPSGQSPETVQSPSAAHHEKAHERTVNAPQPGGLLRPVQSEISFDQHDQTDENYEPGPPSEEFVNTWAKYRHLLKEPLAEWLATCVAVFIGLTGTLAVSTGGSQAGNRLSENWAWGLGFMVGIYLAGGISGAHLNPGISISLWVFRGFPGRRCCMYVVAQILGAITAAGLAYCIYRDAILALAPNVPAGASGLGFYTEPQNYVRPVTAFFTEFIADAILVCVIFAMGDDSNAPPGAGMHSFVIGLVIYVLCICLGYGTGGCLNPVRDFGPRLVALMAGYGSETFTAHGGWWFWGGWVATISGALTGAVLYDTFIFIGGESPINYPRRRRRRAKLKKEKKWRRRLGIGKEKLPSLEEGIKNLED
ncbi:Glycerol uptake facilitator protein [Penicillium diatomitis]|uniref:Glycerol uptake facilitator protein n=1 Tax=Penicillium diatomitis TaxID=2819901 RepID=A0A9W9XEC0_9EURO|nr:Glycerol uptake facilitator protein [Penicillium diatomitis]KAJ5489786.1 Glycerol uptake facilitator protein [Penicillium diatomitis]